jgi:hypothetical protein
MRGKVFTPLDKVGFASHIRNGNWVCAILGEEDDGLHHQFRRHSTSPCPFSSAMNLRYAPATNTSPATMALLTEAYAAARTDGARMRWRKKSTPARP